MYIDDSGIHFQMSLQTSKANVYWLGDISDPVLQVFNKWEKFINTQIPKAKKPKIKWKGMSNALIFHSMDKTMINEILCGTSMLATPKEVKIAACEAPQMVVIKETENLLKQEMLYTFQTRCGQNMKLMLG